MTVLLIGHRGTGKTSLLQGLLRLEPGLKGKDLDAEIEARTGSSVATIIETEGLAAFRALEQKTLLALLEGGGLDVISLGAGYRGPAPDGVEFVWIRRDTDEDGRIFLDRPRLDVSGDPLREYLDRFPDREDRYMRLSDRVVTLPEGLDISRTSPGAEQPRVLCDYVCGRLADVRATVTLMPEQTATLGRLKRAVAHLLSLGVDVELRDDLLDKGALEGAFQEAPAERLLYSARRGEVRLPAQVQQLDWDIGLGDAPAVSTILSFHPDGECTPNDVAQAGERLAEAGQSRPQAQLKLAPVVTSFEALKTGHEWAGGAPGRRSFLPVSPDGRWAWYRLLKKGQPGIHYVREGRGSAPDQPTVLQWRLAADRSEAARDEGHFAAFLGDPARHSRTPARHRDFFAARRQSVVAVRVSEGEWSTALPFLESLGMREAAVSAPLKRLAHGWCDRLGSQAERLGSVNTLHRRQGAWWGGCTDEEGLAQALTDLALNPSEVATAVWGGGGLESVLRDALPCASFCSARTGELRHGHRLARSPELVVYASGRRGAPLPEKWRPSCVFDLDYRENTPGRAYAVRVGAQYVSGKTMFEAQAVAQQRHWAEEDLSA